MMMTDELAGRLRHRSLRRAALGGVLAASFAALPGAAWAECDLTEADIGHGAMAYRRT